MYIFLRKEMNKFAILDTSDGKTEYLLESQVLKLFNSCPSLKIDGLKYDKETQQLSHRSGSVQCEVSNGYVLLYTILNKRTLNVKVSAKIYEERTGKHIRDLVIFESANNDYISCDFEVNTNANGVKIAYVKFEYMDKHYYREDREEYLRYIVIFHIDSSGRFVEQYSTKGWVVDKTCWFDDRTGEIRVV